jgi:stage V sporulation protein G
MTIEVKVHHLHNQNNGLLAFASVTLNNCLAIKDIAIRDGKNGPWVAMPSRKDSEGKYRDTVHPITKEFREKLYGAILAEFAGGKQEPKATQKPPPPEDDLPF